MVVRFIERAVMLSPKTEDTIALHEEQVQVNTKKINVGVTSIATRTEAREEEITIPLISVDVDIERIPVDEIVDTIPMVRNDGETTIIPICEEIMVKRVRIIEEIRVTRRKTAHMHKETVSLRHEIADVSTTPGDTHDN